MMPTTLRDSIREISPPWLKRAVGEAFMYTPAVILDALWAMCELGVKARFPSVDQPDALAFIGRDRRIVRGFDETDANYASRLEGWLDAWRIAGSPLSVLTQLRGYLTPHNPTMRIVTNSGHWFTLDTTGVFSVVRSPVNNWNWDGDLVVDWSRFWVIIYPPVGLWTQGPDWGDPGLWAGAWGSLGYTWGSTATSDQVQTIRAIIQDWKGAHSQCMNIIVAFDPASFDPTGAPGAPLPDGTWGVSSLGNRLTTAIYWDGT